MRFRFVEEHNGAFPTERLCQVMNVSPRGLRAFRSRPASHRQHMDMVVLAHIKEQSRLSLGSYGRPRMTEELKEVGVDVGHRRVGRLMRENGIIVERTRKFKATTDSDHTFNIALNLLDRDFTADQPNQKWAGDISYIWTRDGWLYLAVILDLHSRPSPLDLNQWRTMARHRLGRQQPHETRSGDPGAENGYRSAIPAAGLHLPQRPPLSRFASKPLPGNGQPIVFARLPEDPARTCLPSIDERQGQLLRQCGRRDLLQDHQGRADLAQVLGNASPGRNCHLPIHQRLL